MLQPIHQERVTVVEEPERFYRLVLNRHGEFLGSTGSDGVGIYDYVDDKCIWRQQDDTFSHPDTGDELHIENDGTGDGFKIRNANEFLGGDGNPSISGDEFVSQRGPAHRPSTYLAQLDAEGWVCLPSILPPDVVAGLEQVACTGKWANDKIDWAVSPLAKHPAVAMASAEPVSLWLTRQYMGVSNIKFGHAPSLAVLGKDDGERDVQGWHSDFPYLWGITRGGKGGRIPEHKVDNLVLGIQRNICISAFTREGGATAFKLGSSKRQSAPPADWGNGSTYANRGYRKKHGLPYAGPDADIVDAPAGSIILYDARTWHRAGVNLTDTKRGAMLQAIIPHFMLPFIDASDAYKQFLQCDFRDQLSDREIREMENLMVHRIGGRGGSIVLGMDRELTDLLRPKVEQKSAY